MTEIRIRLGQTPAVTVDGVDISNVVMGVEFLLRPGELASLLLTIAPNAKLDIEADAKVYVSAGGY